MIHYKIRIEGKVQGVWFRASTRDEAGRLGLRGFVRNEPDGSVYAEVEGEENEINEFVKWCH
ncbi:MAG: acylphosphatase, partial [Flavobacteriales bacterium]|nr:acylphosphatase [Flavobacteriales bacterium]